MKKLLAIAFFLMLAAIPAMSQQQLSTDDRAKMTPEQRIAYDNDRKVKKHPKKQDTTKKKVKRAKKEDKKSRKIKQPKHHKNEY